jgi:hypothetical protein
MPKPHAVSNTVKSLLPFWQLSVMNCAHEPCEFFSGLHKSFATFQNWLYLISHEAHL